MLHHVDLGMRIRGQYRVAAAIAGQRQQADQLNQYLQELESGLRNRYRKHGMERVEVVGKDHQVHTVRKRSEEGSRNWLTPQEAVQMFGHGSDRVTFGGK
jgi:hypothetical protein